MTSVAVGECVKVVKKWNPAKEAIGGTFRYIDIASVSQEEKIVVPNGEIPTSEAPSRARQLVESGDVLVSTVRPNLNAVALVPEELDGATASTGFCVLRPNSNRLDSNYLFHWVRTPEFVMDMIKKATGQSYPAVSEKIVKDSLISLPPLEEQKRIAAILDQADSLRRLRQRAIDRLNTLGQAIFYEMFGDPSVGHEGWLKSKVSDLCERVTVGVVVKPASYYQENGIPAIRGTNIKSFGIDLSDIVYFSSADNEKKLAKTRVWEDDIVIVRSGRPGLAAVVPPELNGVNSIDVLIATPIKSKIRPRFFRDLLNSPEGRKIVFSESRGQVQQHFNVGSLSEAEFFLPSIDLQIQYEQALDRLEPQREVLESSQNFIERLFSSLQHRAFRGEL
jgi:type I restriction enzyme S subunit